MPLTMPYLLPALLRRLSMLRSLLFILFLLVSQLSKAQLETSADYRRQVFEKEVTFGIIGHTRGYAINSRFMKFRDGFTKSGLEIDLVKLRHPKEVKSPLLGSGSNSRGFVFNRINSFYTIRTGYIYENVLFDKTDQGTVAITLVVSGGLSLGLVKPVYVQLPSDDAGVAQVKNERYNPLEHNQSNILGESNWFKGIWETKLKPGAYVKVGMNFDYQLIEKKVTALEAGVVYDYFFFPQLGVSGDQFFSKVPVFYQDPGAEDINLTGFFQMYIAFNFGYRKN